MLDEKEYARKFFDLLYEEMEKIIYSDDGNEKNKEYFAKLYECMAEDFALEDVSHIEWVNTWFFISDILSNEGGIQDTGQEEKETKVSQEAKNKKVSQDIVAKYKDIDVCFGILFQCMVFMADSEMNKGYIDYIEDIFKKTKERFKQLKDVDKIPWHSMWQAFMNSDVYSKVIDGQSNNWDSCLEGDSYSNDENFLNRLIYDNINSESKYSRFVCVLKTDYIGFDFPPTSGTDSMKGLKKKI